MLGEVALAAAQPPVGHTGWNVLLRLYGPLEPWFDKSWKPGDAEVVK